MSVNTGFITEVYIREGILLFAMSVIVQQLYLTYTKKLHKIKTNHTSVLSRIFSFMVVFTLMIQSIDAHGAIGIYSRFFPAEVLQSTYLALAWASAFAATYHYIRVLINIEKVTQTRKTKNKSVFKTSIFASIMTVNAVLTVVSVVTQFIMRQVGKSQQNLTLLNSADKFYSAQSSFDCVVFLSIFFYICYTLIKHINNTMKSTKLDNMKSLVKAKHRLKATMLSTTICATVVFFLAFPRLFASYYDKSDEHPYGYPVCSEMKNIDFSDWKGGAPYYYDCSGVHYFDTHRDEIPFSMYDFFVVRFAGFISVPFVLALTWISSSASTDTGNMTSAPSRYTTVSRRTPTHTRSTRIKSPDHDTPHVVITMEAIKEEDKVVDIPNLIRD